MTIANWMKMSPKERRRFDEDEKIRIRKRKNNLLAEIRREYKEILTNK